MSYNFTTLSCQDDSSTSCNGQAGLHYQPSGIGNAIFLAIFILCLLGQVYILIFKKLWGYTVFLGLAFFLEILGYVAKIQLRGNQQNSSAYIMYIICLTIAPNFLSGVLFVSLSRFMCALGRQYSIIPPTAVSWIFILADFLSLCAIGVGGSLAAIYAPRRLGTWIMIGGLAGQAVSILVFSLLALDFWRRRWADRRYKGRTGHGGRQASYIGETFHPAIKRCAYVIGSASVCMLVRSGYRVAELSKGFNGPLAQEEPPFFLLDSLPVSLAAIALTILSPHPDLWYAQKEVARRAGLWTS